MSPLINDGGVIGIFAVFVVLVLKTVFDFLANKKRQDMMGNAIAHLESTLKHVEAVLAQISQQQMLMYQALKAHMENDHREHERLINDIAELRRSMK